MFFKIHFVCWASHVGLGVIYFTLMVGMIIAILNNNPFPWDGIRGGSVLLTPTVLHFVLAIRTGPKPLKHEEVLVVDETVVKDHV